MIAYKRSALLLPTGELADCASVFTRGVAFAAREIDRQTNRT